MRCTSTSAGPAARTRDTARGDERAGDRDRQRTADLLALATGRGHLRLDELDERLAAVWSAASIGKLAVLERDVPHDVRQEHARREAALRARAAAQAGLPGQVRSYLLVMVLLVGIWAVVGLLGGGWYPWPVWPALGWGVAVVGQVRAARAPLP